jgi:hypothetical protein
MSEQQHLSFYMRVYISQTPGGVFATSEPKMRESEPETEEWGPEEGTTNSYRPESNGSARTSKCWYRDKRFCIPNVEPSLLALMGHGSFHGGVKIRGMMGTEVDAAGRYVARVR